MIKVLRPTEPPTEEGILADYLNGDRELPKRFVVNVTSRSKFWTGKRMSPMHLGPVWLYGDVEALNVENAWQYSKVYKRHLHEDGFPNEEWYDWAHAGFTSQRADRYPMGKGAIPEYTWFDYEKLDYIEARKKVYIPIYRDAVENDQLANSFVDWMADLLQGEIEELVLQDFDAYDHHALGYSWEDVVNDPDRKMGHGFVLGQMIEERMFNG